MENNFLKKITYSPFYTIAIALIGFLIWFFDITVIGIIIFAAIFVFVLLLCKDTTLLIPPVILCTFMISKQAAYFNFNDIIYILAPVVAVSLILYFIFKRPQIKRGKFFYGILLACIGAVIGGIGFDYRIENILTVAGFAASVLFVYVFFNSTAGENLKRAAIDSFLCAVIIIILQLLVFYLRADDFTLIVTYKNINVGWGISNNMAFVLSMLLPVTFYKVQKSKYYVLFLILAFLQFFAIIFTMSRGNFLFGGAAFIALFIYCFIKTKNKYNYIITATAICTAVLYISLFCLDIISPVAEKLMEMSFDDHGRISLLTEGLESAKLNPIFGIGFFYKHELIPHWFHNHILQIIASTGIIGSLCFAVFFYQRYAITIRNFNSTNFFMISCIILSGLYGLMECNFFFIYNLIFVMIMYIIIEREKDTFNLFAEIKNKIRKKGDTAKKNNT